MKKYNKGFKGYYHYAMADVFNGSFVVWTQLKNKTIVNMVINAHTGMVDRRMVRDRNHLNFTVK